jgi:hypothetical protein
MSTSSICFCFGIVTAVLIVCLFYSTSFIDEIYTLEPSIITSNYKFKGKLMDGGGIRVSDAERSPLFKSMKIRYE